LIAEYSSVGLGGDFDGDEEDGGEDEDVDEDEDGVVEEEDGNDDILFDLLSPDDARAVASVPTTRFAGTFTGGRVGSTAETGDSMHNKMMKVMVPFPFEGRGRWREYGKVIGGFVVRGTVGEGVGISSGVQGA
jgi:hypothetical protein